MVAGVDEVVIADGVATKHHGGADGAIRARRAAVASRAAARAGVPVPAVLGLDGPVLRTAVVAGRSGRGLLASDPAAVLSVIGDVARRLRAARPPDGLGRAAAGDRWVHGDLCPANVVVDEGGRVVAVLDWEDSRVDDPLCDLVWTEWLVRTHHDAATAALWHLYEASGMRPPPASRRRAAMAAVLARQRRREGAVAAPAWSHHLDTLDGLDLAVAPPDAPAVHSHP